MIAAAEMLPEKLPDLWSKGGEAIWFAGQVCERVRSGRLGFQAAQSDAGLFL
jgi:hypothetical protein